MNPEEEVARSLENPEDEETWKAKQLNEERKGSLAFWILLVLMVLVLAYVYLYLYHGNLFGPSSGNQLLSSTTTNPSTTIANYS